MTSQENARAAAGGKYMTKSSGDGSAVSAPYQLLPPLAVGEMAALRASIELNGVEVPIVVDENGAIIDGHHRAKLAAELGIECPRNVREGLSEDEKHALARSLNRDRRHLTPDQFRALIRGEVLATPDRSDRSIAKDVGATHPTVAKVRRDLEASGELERVSNRTGADGKARKQLASKPAKPKAPPPIVERVIPPPELRDPLNEFDAVVERELNRLEHMTFGKPAAYVLRKVCARLRAAFADLLRAAKADV